MKPIRKWSAIIIVLLGATLALITGITRFTLELNPGLALIASGVLYPLGFSMILSHNTLLSQLSKYLSRTSFNKSILHFSCLFWYLGILFIISYRLYENIFTYFPSIFAGGLVGGYILRWYLKSRFNSQL